MNLNFKTIRTSPLGIVIKVALAILSVEFLIMVSIEAVFLPLFGKSVSAGFWEFMDPVLLTFILTPLLYVLILKPMRAQQSKLEQQKNEIRESEESFRSIVNQIIYGIVQSDITNHITYVNDRYCEITGYSREELIGKNWFDITHPDDIDRNALEIEQYFKMNKPHKIEKRYIRKNGEIVWVSIGASLRQLTRENSFGFTSIVMDITERKLMEKEIQERQDEMEQLQKLYVSNQTASAIAHELNQPLLAISAYSKAANMLFNSGQYQIDEICEALNSIESQAYRAGKVIRDILDSLMTKEFAAEVLDLNQEIVAGIDAAISDHGLQFSLTYNLERRHTLVRANRIHLQKILVNLLQNAADAMKESGVSQPLIHVTTCWINDKNIAQVTIQDNGSGIKTEDIKRLFDAFFTTKKDGIGMGLAISRSLIEENGGRLWFDPLSGPGASFHLTLPIAL